MLFTFREEPGPILTGVLQNPQRIADRENMQKIFLAQAVRHVFKTSFFRLIVCVFLVISVALLLVEKEIVFPTLEKFQQKSIESSAIGTANHLRKLLHIQREPVAPDLTTDFERNLQEIMKDFELIKIKIFNSTGTVIYSSDPNEIGVINSHNYFHDQVVQGQVFSKIVEENQASAEGKLVPTSVAEVYVPIVNDGQFRGAFEIYYDITEQNLGIIKNEVILKIASLSTWLLLTLIFVSLLIKASRGNLLKEQAEVELTETNRWLARTVAEQIQEIRATQKVSVQALAILAEHHDPDTGEHLGRIQIYVRTLLEYLASNPNKYCEYVLHQPSYIEEIVFASLLHDIGKTAIPVEILLKPGKLTPEEFDIVKTHTIIAGQTLGRANQLFREEFNKDSYLSLAGDIALYHHEKWNGEGYPYQLRGEDIPLSARITAIADVYDALTSERPYKKAWPHDRAFQEIINGSGSHFDPELVEVFRCCEEKFKRISVNSISRSLLN
jgi:response regulator RpfG family c-di-GMP phosphodiesterase